MKYSIFSKSHRVLALIDKCLERPNNIVYASEIAEHWDCDKKTARRLIRFLVYWAKKGSFFMANEIKGSLDPKDRDQIGICLRLIKPK